MENLNRPFLVTTREVITLTGMSRSTLHRKRQLAQFPEAIDIGNGRIRFRLDEIESYIESLPRATSVAVSSQDFRGRLH